jgi:hypothetical protein
MVPMSHQVISVGKSVIEPRKMLSCAVDFLASDLRTLHLFDATTSLPTSDILSSGNRTMSRSQN